MKKFTSIIKRILIECTDKKLINAELALLFNETCKNAIPIECIYTYTLLTLFPLFLTKPFVM